MATATQVRVGFERIAREVDRQRTLLTKVQTVAQRVSDALAALPDDYADVLETARDYGNADGFEKAMRDERAKVVAEYAALKRRADAIAAMDLSAE